MSSSILDKSVSVRLDRDFSSQTLDRAEVENQLTLIQLKMDSHFTPKVTALAEANLATT